MRRLATTRLKGAAFYQLRASLGWVCHKSALAVTEMSARLYFACCGASPQRGLGATPAYLKKEEGTFHAYESVVSCTAVDV